MEGQLLACPSRVTIVEKITYSVLGAGISLLRPFLGSLALLQFFIILQVLTPLFGMSTNHVTVYNIHLGECVATGVAYSRWRYGGSAATSKDCGGKEEENSPEAKFEEQEQDSNSRTSAGSWSFRIA
jgi:hypothetical protein